MINITEHYRQSNSQTKPITQAQMQTSQQSYSLQMFIHYGIIKMKNYILFILFTLPVYLHKIQ